MMKLKNKLLNRIRLNKAKLKLGCSWWIYRQRTFANALSKCDKAKAKILIIGGNSGIARSVRSKLNKLRIHHDITTRNKHNNSGFYLDYNDSTSINNFISATDFSQYDTIIFFTGYLDPSSDEIIKQETPQEGSCRIELARTSFEQHTRINALYPHMIAGLIGQKLKTRISKKGIVPITPQHKQHINFVFLTSSIGTSCQTIFPSLYYYRAGKAALHAMLTAFYLELNMQKSAELNKIHFGILLLGPGSAKTKMNPNGNITADQSAELITPIILDPSISGLFLFMDHRRRRLHL